MGSVPRQSASTPLIGPAPRLIHRPRQPPGTSESPRVHHEPVVLRAVDLGELGYRIATQHES
jgi:hypothetical protein